MINYKKQLALICAFSLTILLGCSENPFSDPPEVGTSQIKGRVQLRHDSDNSGVYVWIEQIAISAYTNSDGEFLITIPSPESQGGGGGIDGDLLMYFYLANYEMDSVTVLFLRGVPLVSKGDLDEKGNVARIIELSKLLNVELSFSKNPYSISSSDSLGVTITLTSPSLDSVFSIMTRKPTKDVTPLPAFFIKKVDSEESILKTIDIGDYVNYVNIITNTVIVTFEVKMGFLEGDLPTGTYEVIPYVTLRDVIPPAELLNSLGEKVLEYHPDYLKLPFKRLAENIILTE